MKLVEKGFIGGLLSKNDHIFKEVMTARKGKAFWIYLRCPMGKHQREQRGDKYNSKQGCKIKIIPEA